MCSQYSRVCKCIVENGVFDGGEDKADVGCVRRLSEAGFVMLGWIAKFSKWSERQVEKSNLLRIEVQVCPVDLVETPKQIFCRPVHVVSS